MHSYPLPPLRSVVIFTLKLLQKRPCLLVTVCVGPRVYPALHENRKLCASIRKQIPADQCFIGHFRNLSIPANLHSQTDPEFKWHLSEELLCTAYTVNERKHRILNPLTHSDEFGYAIYFLAARCCLFTPPICKILRHLVFYLETC
jgi:hypothetical protein